jgi:hypothetical protein
MNENFKGTVTLPPCAEVRRARADCAAGGVGPHGRHRRRRVGRSRPARRWRRATSVRTPAQLSTTTPTPDLSRPDAVRLPGPRGDGHLWGSKVGASLIRGRLDREVVLGDVVPEDWSSDDSLPSSLGPGGSGWGGRSCCPRSVAVGCSGGRARRVRGVGGVVRRSGCGR